MYSTGKIMQNFTNKKILITGAGSGIGKCLALQFANLGAHLILTDNNLKNLVSIHEQILTLSADSSYYLVDVSDYPAMQALSDKVFEDHGDIDILINNAGVTLMDHIVDGKLDDFHWVMNINFWGVVNGVKVFLPSLLRQQEAHIVNLSSIFGIMSVPGQAAYNSSKFAVKGFTEALKMELTGTSVKVSSVHPGGVKTAIAENARMGLNITAASKDKLINEFNKSIYTSAEKAAMDIIKGIKKNKRRIMIGWDARIADIIVRLFPSHYEDLMALEKRYKKLQRE
jgi:butyryl-CoA dehydrogenase